jgi:hypothetical protein
LDYWSNTRVRLNDVWGGAGVQHSLSTPLGPQQLPEFSLRPRNLRDSSGARYPAHFTIEFPSGFLADGWQGVNFVPMGSTPPAGISSLPAWDGSAQVKAKYRQVIDAAAGSLSDSRTLRLEAVIPYLDQGQLGYNNVRLFYVPNAVTTGPTPDLVVVTTATHALAPGRVQGKQNGNGQGPPD